MTAIGTLRVRHGDGTESTIELVSDVVLGRDLSADVVLTDPSGQVSRRHARIVIRGTEAVIEDLMSTNGTFVNGERLDGPYALRAGDKVELGTCTLEFVPATPPAFGGFTIRLVSRICSTVTAGLATALYGMTFRYKRPFARSHVYST